MSEHISLIQKKIIHSILYGDYDIINIFFARIYTSGEESNFWLYSRLEGALIFCIDVRLKVAKFLLFNLKSFEIVFDCDLYRGFNKKFIKGSTNNFFYFGVNDGYIGLEIPNLEEVSLLEEVISLHSDDMLKSRIRNFSPMREGELKEKGRKNIKILKQKLITSGNKNIEKEIIFNQGELEKTINNIEIDDKNGILFIIENEYNDIIKKLKKLKGIKISRLKNNKDNKIFSKYIARNIILSNTQGLVVPKRKIPREYIYVQNFETEEKKDDTDSKIYNNNKILNENSDKIKDNKIINENSDKIKDNNNNDNDNQNNIINKENQINIDKKYIKDVKEVKDIKEVKEVKDVKDIKEVKDVKDVNDVKDIKDIKDNKDTKEIKDDKDNNDNNDNNEIIEVKDYNDDKEIKDNKICLYFISCDQKINQTIKCRANEGFHILEGLLYEKYPEYKDTENYFLVNGNKISRFKNLKENNIKDGDTIMLNIINVEDF